MVPPGLSFSLLPFMVRKLSCYVSVFSLFPISCLDPVNKSQGTGVSPGNEASPTVSSHTLLQTNEVAGGAYQTIWKLFVYSHHSWSILSLLAHRCSINSISLFTSMSEKKKKNGTGIDLHSGEKLNQLHRASRFVAFSCGLFVGFYLSLLVSQAESLWSFKLLNTLS